MKTITFIFLIFNTLFFKSQTVGINQIDSNGKKDGKWVVYLDNNWKKLKDSVNAVYYRYTYYDHGVNIYPMGASGGKKFKLDPSFVQGSSSTSGLILLDGEYKWYKKNGKISSIHIFKNGEYIMCKEFYKSGQLHQFFDYTKKCDGQQHGWSLLIYNKEGGIELESYTCKDKNGVWPKMR